MTTIVPNSQRVKDVDEPMISDDSSSAGPALEQGTSENHPGISPGTRPPTNVKVDSQGLPNGGNVGDIIGKAKRAAASLWMVLHAQGCHLSESRCPHSGCTETKKLLLHVKLCAAGPDFACPTGYRGCQQCRKLLAHYRRCREIRARQVLSSRRNVRQQQSHSCLVCCLVARHAKTARDGESAPVRSTSVPTSVVGAKMFSSGAKQKRPEKNTVIVPAMLRSTSVEIMPPPPPRPPTKSRANLQSSTPISVGASRNSQHYTNDDSFSPVYATPPSKSQLMGREIRAAAAAAAFNPFGGQPVDPSLLGKSYDSSQSSKLFQGYARSHSSSPESGEERFARSIGRPRAESFDERKNTVSIDQTSHSPLRRRNSVDNRFDPTLEVTLTQDNHSEDEANIEDYGRSKESPKRRSSSCGGLSSLVRAGGCDTIVEEDPPYENPRRLDAIDDSDELFTMDGDSESN